MQGDPLAPGWDGQPREPDRWDRLRDIYEKLRLVLDMPGLAPTGVDDLIEQFSHGWKLSRISRTALAVLRVALYEILYMPDIPAAASINEAVELAKGYDEPETVRFINGILGSFMRSRGETVEEQPAETEPAEDAAAEEDGPTTEE